MENIVNVINELGLREISFNKEGSKYGEKWKVENGDVISEEEKKTNVLGKLYIFVCEH